MNDQVTKKNGEKQDAAAAPPVDNTPLPTIKIERPSRTADWATILGATLAVAFIALAIVIGQSKASFFDLPSVIIVIFGTMAATAIAFSPEELARTGGIVVNSFARRIQNPRRLAYSLVDLAVVSKKKGILALVSYEKELNKDPFLARAIQMVADGFQGADIDRLLTQEIDALAERHRRSASVARRASELAPAMGLIGTLVGLVQMLAELENPEAIGPAMAVALLTTFYGAILGTVILAPLAVKLEKNSADETLIKTLIKTATVSIARHENPRQLEMLLNADLPPLQRIKYFD